MVKSYAVQVHRYGSVAVVMLCVMAERADGEVCLERLVDVLAGTGARVGHLVLDLDRAPYPAPADALATVGAWAARREVPVVALTSSNRPGGVRRPCAGHRRASHSPTPQLFRARMRRRGGCAEPLGCGP
ncbi:hypothetical protein ABTX77_22715 [Streptomyces sp. NPDC097704]|uniref:hypothetical protein n=1 Tax=Streptomyces sp. NPDC097704 TaxID=3157101 RepID=UPI0033243808